MVLKLGLDWNPNGSEDALHYAMTIPAVNDLLVSDVNVATKELSQHSDKAARIYSRLPCQKSGNSSDYWIDHGTKN